jgi:hypothetical protein
LIHVSIGKEADIAEFGLSVSRCFEGLRSLRHVTPPDVAIDAFGAILR